MLIKKFPIKTAGSGDNEHSICPLVLICPGGGYGIQTECQEWIPLVKTWLGNKFGYGGRL